MMKPIQEVATLFLWLLVSVWLAYGQATVVIDSDGKRLPLPTTSEECSRIEPLKPNLVLRSDTVIHGTLADQTKAPFSNSRIQLRRYISETAQVLVKTVETDKQGNFDLGVIKAGEYRLLLSPNRGFAQPTELDCLSTDCKINEVLVANGTDGVAAACPIR
ncbi:MAG: carboxypeptidase-like regulatory domain-containing protein [Candidatus Korobacteraceae bacterium]